MTCERVRRATCLRRRYNKSAEQVRDLWIKAQGCSSSVVVCFPVVNRPVRLPAAGRAPHAGWWGGWGLETPG